jgi:AraC family transcriptional regulator of adaptative response/methylated-DNA-[protein]-cysteine methyltransferase
MSAWLKDSKIRIALCPRNPYYWFMENTINDDYRRIAKAILYLENHVLEQPSLEDIAEQVHLSPYHFQRLFTRWAGVSPKRFLQFLTLEHAKQLLKSGTQLDATFQAGLSSPSRLHDLFVAVDAVTPGEYKALGSGLEIAYGLHPSPFGECLLAVTERGLCALSFVDEADPRAALQDLRRRWSRARLLEDNERTAAMIRRVFDSSAESNHAPIPLLLKGTNFQIKVWEALLRIPPGAVTSYSRLATAIGNPAAGRAVGSAVGANPIAYLIPCHRVILSTGAFGNYRYGALRKKAILGWEQAQLLTNRV